MLATKCVSMHSVVDGSSSSRRDSQPIDFIQVFLVYILRLLRYNSLKSKGKGKEMTCNDVVAYGTCILMGAFIVMLIDVELYYAGVYDRVMNWFDGLRK